MKTRFVVVVLATLVMCACDRHSAPVPTAPSPGGTTPPPDVPTAALVRVTASGNTTLSAVGETTQLKVTGQYSDGTTKDLVDVPGWVSTDPNTIAVSSTGLATARRLGSAYVYFNYQSKQATVTVKATPPGTFVIWGRVREPGSGGLANVAVRTDRGETLMTDTDGLYTTGGLSGTVQLSATADGFEPVSVKAASDEFQDLPLQRVVRLSEGRDVSFTLAPHDMEYEVSPGIQCSPCRLVRVSVGFTGTLELAATWTDSRARLNIWVKGRELVTEGPGALSTTGTLQVTPGELELYVGTATSTATFYVPTTVAARVR